MEVSPEGNAAMPRANVVVGWYDSQLRQVSEALELATTTDDPAVIAAARAALANFFSYESTLGPFAPTKPQTHRTCQLVYMLSAKRPSNDLSPELFTEKDARVASILTQFCHDSDGAMELYLCQTRYHSVESTRSVIEWRGRNHLLQTLVLLSPWTRLTPCDASPTIQVSGFFDDYENPTSAIADVEREVAPWGIFERPDFEFDDQTGTATRESWHVGTALVLLPIRLRAHLEFSGDEDAMLTNWLRLVDSHPSLAIAVMHALGEARNEWTLGSPMGAKVLGGIKKLRSVPALVGLLKCSWYVEFLSEMHDAVSVFTTEELVSVLRCVYKPEHVPATAWCPANFRLTSCLNTVASILHGETDVTRITSLLDALPLRPSSWMNGKGYPPGAVDQTAEGFARLLQVALRVSVDRAKTLATMEGAFNAKRDAVTVARAVRVLVDWHGGPQACGADVMELVRHAHAQLAVVLPAIRNAPYSSYRRVECSATDGCELCDCLQAFVHATDETAEFDKLTCEAHFLERLQRMNATDQFTIGDVDDANGTRFRLTKSHESDDFKQAEQHAAALLELIERHAE